METETTGWKMVLEILGEGELQESTWVSGFSNLVTGGTFIEMEESWEGIGLKGKS